MIVISTRVGNKFYSESKGRCRFITAFFKCKFFNIYRLDDKQQMTCACVCVEKKTRERCRREQFHHIWCPHLQRFNFLSLFFRHRHAQVSLVQIRVQPGVRGGVRRGQATSGSGGLTLEMKRVVEEWAATGMTIHFEIGSGVGGFH